MLSLAENLSVQDIVLGLNATYLAENLSVQDEEPQGCSASLIYMKEQ